MAKYEVKFSCGHTQIIELFGKDKDRHLSGRMSKSYTSAVLLSPL